MCVTEQTCEGLAPSLGAGPETGCKVPGDSILVVDDNPLNTKLASLILEDAGYVLRTANSADEAQAILDRECPRLVLMDLEMPGVDGYELTRRIKKNPRTRAIRVVAFTALLPEDGAQQAKAAGCDGYISKPIDSRTLPGEVEKYLVTG